MSHPLAPTKILPTLTTLNACAAACVGDALATLRDVYFPRPPSTTTGSVPALRQSLSNAVWAVRPARTVRSIHHHGGVPDSGYASEEDDDDNTVDETTDEEEVEEDGDEEALDVLRSDELERGYAIRWLTGLVKRGDAWVSGTCDSPASGEQTARAARLEEASKLLARFAGDDDALEEDVLIRSFVFPFRMPSCRRCCNTSLPPAPITIELNDAPINGADHTAVGLQSWGSAIIFAQRMCLNPERYLGTLDPCAAPLIREVKMKTTAPRRRILELGAGTGLLSITVAQILSRTSVQGEIIATDDHPSVLENLSRNVTHNRDCNRGGVDVRVDKLDWCDADVDGDGYDIVLAADVVYHPEHAGWIRGCVERTLKQGGVFWLIVPVRTIGRHAGLGETVDAAFPVVDGAGEGRCAGEGKGEDRRLAIVGSECVGRVDGVGRADEGGYKLFEIRWM